MVNCIFFFKKTKTTICLDALLWLFNLFTVTAYFIKNSIYDYSCCQERNVHAVLVLCYLKSECVFTFLFFFCFTASSSCIFNLGLSTQLNNSSFRFFLKKKCIVKLLQKLKHAFVRITVIQVARIQTSSKSNTGHIRSINLFFFFVYFCKIRSTSQRLFFFLNPLLSIVFSS